ncbi:hypothetical protein D3C78_966710 [compost metagenome]
MLRFTAAVADRRTELLAVARIQPLISFVDRRVSKVGQVATGLAQFGLAGDITPDDAQLLAVALAAQVACQLFFTRRRLGRCRDLPTQLARRIPAVHLAAGQQGKQHRRLTLGQAEHEVAGGGHLVELVLVSRAPGGRIECRVAAQGIEQKLPITGDQRLQGGRQFERQRQAHGLSLIGVKVRVKSGHEETGPRLDCRTKVGNS